MALWRVQRAVYHAQTNTFTDKTFWERKNFQRKTLVSLRGFRGSSATRNLLSFMQHVIKEHSNCSCMARVWF